MAKKSNVRGALGQVFDGLREGLRKSLPPEEYERLRAEFVFHMTDWEDDLKQLAAFVSRPEHWNQDSASALVVGFLYHVVPHLKCARELLLDGDSVAAGLQESAGTRGA